MADFGTVPHRSDPAYVPRLSLLPLLALLILSAGMSVRSAVGQTPSRWFIEGQGHLNLYAGDRVLASSPGLRSRTGTGVGLTLGWSLPARTALTLRVASGTYPGVDDNVLVEPVFDNLSSDRRTTLVLAGRAPVVRLWRIRTFAEAGLGLATGRINDEDLAGWGPSIGGGAEIDVMGVPVFGRMDVLIPFHDYVLDAARTGGRSDVALSAALGVRYRRTPRPPRFEDIVITAPSVVRVGEDAVFTLSGSLDPSEFSVLWDLGDGASAITASTVHRYEAPGAYTVRVQAGNARSDIERTFVVRVEATFQPVEIVTLAVSPRAPRVGDAVDMNPVLRGDVSSCLWDFGDGSGDDECATTHVFSEPGTYRMELRVRNDDHAAQAVQLVTIRSNACLDVPALHSVFFRRGSSELSLDMRALLRQNAASMGSCPEQPLDVQGVALHGEGGAVLADARADAVVQYYLNLGFPASRIRRPAAQVVPDGGDVPEQSRRVDSYLIVED